MSEIIKLSVHNNQTMCSFTKEMQNFAGALGCSPVRKGVFITTSFFDERAKKKAASVQGKIIRLVDGEELTKLMIKHNLGVQVKTKIEDIYLRISKFVFPNTNQQTKILTFLSLKSLFHKVHSLFLSLFII